MSIPSDRRYTREHEWVKLEADGTATVGITHHAQDALGDVVFVELPKVGRKLAPNATFGVVESVKSVSDCFAPLAGEVVAVNSALEGAPATVNSDCYGEGWLVRLRLDDPEAFGSLLDAAAYAAFLG